MRINRICLFGIAISFPLLCQADTNTLGEPAAQVSPEFFENAPLLGQIFTVTLASMLSVLGTCFILWLASVFSQHGSSVRDVPSHSLTLNTLKGLWPDCWLVTTALLPFALLHFHARWFLIANGSYILIRILVQIKKEHDYLKHINTPMPTWSVEDEVAIDATLKEKAEQNRIKLAQEEEVIIRTAKTQKHSHQPRIRIILPPKS